MFSGTPSRLFAARSFPGFTGITLALACLTGGLDAGQSGPLTYSETTTSVTITRCATAAAGEVLVPEVLAGKPVKEIGPSAFENCTSITGVTLPPGLTRVGDSAFSGCKAIRTMELPSGVTYLGASAFAYCGLGSVTVPGSVGAIRKNTFFSCFGLYEVTLGSGIKSIGAKAFYQCSSLETIEIPDSVKSLGASSFASCPWLSEVKLPAGLTRINTKTFSHCQRLRGIALPVGIREIGSYAFAFCDLYAVKIPAKVKSVAPAAFARNRRLASATFEGNAPKNVGKGIFQNAAGKFTVYSYVFNKGFTTPKWKGYRSVRVEGPVPFGNDVADK